MESICFHCIEMESIAEPLVRSARLQINCLRVLYSLKAPKFNEYVTRQNQRWIPAGYGLFCYNVMIFLSLHRCHVTYPNTWFRGLDRSAYAYAALHSITCRYQVIHSAWDPLCRYESFGQTGIAGPSQDSNEGRREPRSGHLTVDQSWMIWRVFTLLIDANWDLDPDQTIGTARRSSSNEISLRAVSEINLSFPDVRIEHVYCCIDGCLLCRTWNGTMCTWKDDY